jgi:hypothetical protein
MDPSRPVELTVSITKTAVIPNSQIPDTSNISIAINGQHSLAKGSLWFDGDDTDCIGNCGCGCTDVMYAISAFYNKTLQTYSNYK